MQLCAKLHTKKRLKREAPLSMWTIENRLAKRACPTPSPPGEMGMAIAVKPTGIKVKAYLSGNACSIKGFVSNQKVKIERN